MDDDVLLSVVSLISKYIYIYIISRGQPPEFELEETSQFKHRTVTLLSEVMRATERPAFLQLKTFCG